jgi:hypothetical protein
MEPVLSAHFEYATHTPQFNAARKHAELELADNNFSVKSTTGGAHKCVYGTQGFSMGQHYFCFEITDRGPSAHVMIGVSAGGVDTAASHYPGIAGADGVSLFLAN